jgi:hypothetical protein
LKRESIPSKRPAYASSFCSIRSSRSSDIVCLLNADDDSTIVGDDVVSQSRCRQKCRMFSATSRPNVAETARLECREIEFFACFCGLCVVCANP